MEPLRVLHMIGSLNIGGSQTMVLNLYRAIDREKVQFDFIIDHKDHTYLEKTVEELGARVYYLPGFNGKNLLEVIKAWNRFFIDHSEYKILHSHVRSYASIYLPIAKKYGLKTIIHSHSTSNGKGVSSIAKRILQFPLRYQSDYYFGCSKESGKWLFGKKITNSKSFVIMPNAIDTKKYYFSEEKRTRLRDELGITNEYVFIHVGRLFDAKNHEFLINLFSKIHLKDVNTKLILVGDGSLKENIEKQISNLGIGDSVIMTGMRDDVAGLLNAADCFLFPSLWEGFPMTVLEAQAAGLPCLISNTITKEVGVSELVKYLPIDHGADCWMDAITKLDYSRKNVRNRIIESGYDINTSAKWLETLYFEIIK